MSLFRCPVCKAPLARGARAYACPSGHSYDLAREGYAYLLPPTKNPPPPPETTAGWPRPGGTFYPKGIMRFF